MSTIPMSMPNCLSQRARELADQLLKTLDDSPVDILERAEAALCVACAIFALSGDNTESLAQILTENITIIVAENRKAMSERDAMN